MVVLGDVFHLKSTVEDLPIGWCSAPLRCWSSPAQKYLDHGGGLRAGPRRVLFVPGNRHEQYRSEPKH